jgi:hypothetical protein
LLRKRKGRIDERLQKSVEHLAKEAYSPMSMAFCGGKAGGIKVA